jgi:hypothetical protein
MLAAGVSSLAASGLELNADEPVDGWPNEKRTNFL